MKKNTTISNTSEKRENNQLLASYNSIIFEDAKLREFISSWLSLRGWSLDSFPYILDILGIDRPVKMLNLNEDTFYAKTLATNRCIKITLSTNGIENLSSIELEEFDVTSIYSINFKFNSSISLQLTPEKKIICKDKKHLICLYSNSYQYSLKINDYVLDIDKSFEFELHDTTTKIEEYLLTLELSDFIYDVSSIYHALRKIWESHFKISNNTILISSSKLRANNKPSLITSKICVNSDSLLTEFAVSKLGEGTYHLFENGDWKWRSSKPPCKISYFAKKQTFSLSMYGNYDVLSNNCTNIILDNTISTIYELKKNIGKVLVEGSVVF